MTVSFFVPCFLDQAAPDTAAAAARLLNRLGVPWEYPPEQTCCGQFAFTVGEVGAARRLMRRFLQVFQHADAIVCPSASCTLMVRRHYPELAETPGERRLAHKLAGRIRELSEFVSETGLLPGTLQLDTTLVLHHSCKARQLGALGTAAVLLRRIQKLRLLSPPAYHACCGFGGVFRWQHPDLAAAIARAYLQAVAATGAAGLVTLDFSCALHLRPVAAGLNLPLSFLHLAEVLLSAWPGDFPHTPMPSDRG